ncbi:Gas vesicle protein [Gracilibacillus ureilyticus]|uniref:Gas vesicle protein n=1 Tax=Gracilibacillus ureilyticus TaxID=531814 RepID=A0A1H9SKL1_9BACI|nr:YtxH domain-containing protein [Gracilibacillus ureilyticus]SER85438.1 Gas vesicle protein [Gracilibacillus ureilyticus]
MINAKSLLFGIVVGGAISATATLLNAPKPGREFRYDVKHKGDEAIQAFKHFKEDGVELKDQIAKTSKEGAALIKDLSADVKQSIESWKQTVEPHQKNIQKYLNQIEKSLKELEEKTKKQTEEA